MFRAKNDVDVVFGEWLAHGLCRPFRACIAWLVIFISVDYIHGYQMSSFQDLNENLQTFLGRDNIPAKFLPWKGNIYQRWTQSIEETNAT